MHVITANNVRDALPQAVHHLLEVGNTEQTRNGDAIVAPEPVCIVYRNPKQHVLVNPIRDANPFFHLMEAMWMLAGRQDGAFLDHYIKNFSRDFGNNGIIMDAYGYRWRWGLRACDQLDEVVAQLRKDLTTRQAVLQIWGAGVNDLRSSSSKPCNLVATFRVVNGQLDMTVFNRSNDLIWGCCGANAVHFPILQEYIAGRIEVPMGTYRQVSTNLHLYMAHVNMFYKRLGGNSSVFLDMYLKDSATYEQTQPLITNLDYFEEELMEVVDYIEALNHDQEIYTGNISNGFLREVVIPMAVAHRRYKHGDYTGASEAIAACTAEDWQRAGREWLERRFSKAGHPLVGATETIPHVAHLGPTDGS